MNRKFFRKSAVILTTFALFMLSACSGSETDSVIDNVTDSTADSVTESVIDSVADDAMTSIQDDSSEAQEETETESDEDAVPASADGTESEAQTGTTTAHLVCVGDNLIHDNIYVEALEKGEGETYDFTDCYANIKKYIEGADVAIINQETLVTDEYEPTSYPTFATPTEVGDAILDLGFNVVSMSNNHVLDKGSDGLVSSLDYWDSTGVLHYGAYRSQEDADNIKTMEVNGITFAFLGYTENTNGLTLDDSGAEVIYLSEEDVIKKQIKEADKIADVVVVSCHYGTEVSHELNSQQITLTPKLVKWGADLIIGTQAHAVSSCEYLDKPDGGQAFVYYGLGNFFSTMYDTHALVGLLGDLDVVKNYDTGEVTFENVKAIPLVSHFEADSYDSYWYNCTLYSYADYTDKLLQSHYMYNAGFSRSSIEECLSYVPSEFLSIE